MLIDAGNFCTPWRTRYQYIKDRYFFEAMKRLGYDAIAVGPDDVRFGRKRLLKTVEEYDLPLVSSNIIDKRGTGHLGAPYIIRTVGGSRLLFWRRGGLKVGILSVVLPAYIHSINEEIDKYYDVSDTRISALETISTLKEAGCELIIALSHLGWENSLEFAEAVPGVDIVINGHRTHNGMYHEYVGETIVVDTGINRSSFAEITVTIENGTPGYNAQDMGKVLLSFDGDPEFTALEKSYEKELRESRTNTAQEGR